MHAQALNPWYRGGKPFQFELQHSHYSNWVTWFFDSQNHLFKAEKIVKLDYLIFLWDTFSIRYFRDQKTQTVDFLKMFPQMPFLHSSSHCRSCSFSAVLAGVIYSCAAVEILSGAFSGWCRCVMEKEHRCLLWEIHCGHFWQLCGFHFLNILLDSYKVSSAICMVKRIREGS